jgi:peptide/nickel transport system permease protein
VLTYVIRRLLVVVPTMLAMVVLIAAMISLVPGDPVTLMIGQEVSGEAIAAKRHELGLDRPMPVQLGHWLLKATHGDLGSSYFLNQPVSTAIVERYSVTVNVACFSLLIAIMVGMSVGVLASVRQGKVFDWGAMILSLIVLSIPSFWLALNLIFLFVVTVQWFPLGGFVPLRQDPVEYFRHLALPCLSLGLGEAAILARVTRTSMLEVLRSDYLRTARAKGLREATVIYAHALRNVLIPIITVAGMSAGVFLGGSVVTETVYSLPGVGRMIVEGVVRRDYPVIQGGILVVTLTYLVINLVVDLLYMVVDPRVRYE